MKWMALSMLVAWNQSTLAVFHSGDSMVEENELQSLSLEESMTSVVARASATKRRSKA
eukprot:symbB.v1.2.039516.t1/scaffold6620.1/size16663/1